MEVHFPSISSCQRKQYHKSQAPGCSVISYLNHRGLHGRSASLLDSRLQVADTLYQKDLTAHYGCVNALDFSKNGQHLISGGDDRRVLLWNVCHSVLSDGPTTSVPVAMSGKHNSNIFSVAFTSNADKIFSAGNDQMVIMHDTKTGYSLNTFMHEAAVYCVTVSPDNDTVFATASEDGQLLLYDTRTSCDWDDNQMQVSQSHYAFHSVQFHPQQSALLLSANYKEGVALWDSRNCTGPLIRYGGHRCLVSTMSASFNSTGDTVLALRRRHTPVLYHTRHTAPAAEFDAPHYYNSCTMKSCCFAGEGDQLVLSGSDDFSLYAWRVPNLPQPEESSPVVKVTEPHLTLRGHRSIVNQVRYSGVTGLIASAGVGKTVKVWSSLAFPGPQVTGEARITRRVFTHSQYIRLIMQAASHEPHDYTDGNTDEDPRMMAFFDSLVQREIDGYSFFSDGSLTQSSTETESSEDSPSDDDDPGEDMEPVRQILPMKIRDSGSPSCHVALSSKPSARKSLRLRDRTRRRQRHASEHFVRTAQHRNLRRRIDSYLSLTEVLELCAAVGLDVDNMLDLHRQQAENDDLRAAAAEENASDGSSDEINRDVPIPVSAHREGILSREPAPESRDPSPTSASRDPAPVSRDSGPNPISREFLTDTGDDSSQDSATHGSGIIQQNSRVTESTDNINASSSGQGGSTRVTGPADSNFHEDLSRPGCSTRGIEPFNKMTKRIIASSSDTSEDSDASDSARHRPTTEFESCGDSSSDSSSDGMGSSPKRKRDTMKQKCRVRKKHKRTFGTSGHAVRQCNRSAVPQSAPNVPDVHAGPSSDNIRTSRTTAKSNDNFNVAIPEVLNKVTVVTGDRTANQMESETSQVLIDLSSTSTGIPRRRSSSSSSTSSTSGNSSGSNSSSLSIGRVRTNIPNTSNDNISSPNFESTTTIATNYTTTTTTPSVASDSTSPAVASSSSHNNATNSSARTRITSTRNLIHPSGAGPRTSRAASYSTSDTLRSDVAFASIPTVETSHTAAPPRERVRRWARLPLGPPFDMPDFSRSPVVARSNRVHRPNQLRSPELPVRPLQCGGELHSYDLVLDLIASKRQQREQRRNLRRQNRRLRRYAARQARRIIQKEAKRRAKNEQLFQKRWKRRSELFGDEERSRNAGTAPDPHSLPSSSRWPAPRLSAATGSTASGTSTPIADCSSSSHPFYCVRNDGRRSRPGQVLAPYTLLDSDDNLNNQHSEEISSSGGSNDEGRDGGRLRWLLNICKRIPQGNKRSTHRNNQPDSTASGSRQSSLTLQPSQSRGGLGFYVPMQIEPIPERPAAVTSGVPTARLDYTFSSNLVSSTPSTSETAAESLSASSNPVSLSDNLAIASGSSTGNTSVSATSTVGISSSTASASTFLDPFPVSQSTISDTPPVHSLVSQSRWVTDPSSTATTNDISPEREAISGRNDEEIETDNS